MKNGFYPAEGQIKLNKKKEKNATKYAQLGYLQTVAKNLEVSTTLTINRIFTIICVEANIKIF